MFVDKTKAGNAQFTGYIPDLLSKIKAKTAIEYDIKLVTDGKYGGKVGNNWDGMMGELLGDVSMTYIATSRLETI